MTNEERRDQVAAEHEEHSDVEEPAREARLEVMGHDAEDRDGPDGVERRSISRAK